MVMEKENINRLIKLYVFTISLLLAVKRNIFIRKIYITVALVEILLWDARYKILFEYTNDFSKISRSAELLVCFGFIHMLLILLFGSWIENNKYEIGFLSNGFKNSSGFAPILKDSYKKKGVNYYTFVSRGINIEIWKKRYLDVENAMDITIDSIELGKNNYEVVICAVDGKAIYQKEKINSNTGFSDDGIVVLGNGLINKKKVDLNVSPHMLIAGSTGSGKTWLFKSVLMQLQKQGAEIYLADFKGGVDYPASKWKDKCIFIADINIVEKSLKSICEELQRRKKILSEQDNTSNISEYNATNSDFKMKRILFACDELAQLTDLKGMSKEEKIQREKIIKYMVQIAQLGRAFGIHLILSTQRPDADVVPGQIKNNIDTRICGRADTTLSTIILGSGIADEKIPKNEQGLFIDNNGDVFRGFIIDC